MESYSFETGMLLIRPPHKLANSLKDVLVALGRMLTKDYVRVSVFWLCSPHTELQEKSPRHNNPSSRSMARHLEAEFCPSFNLSEGGDVADVQLYGKVVHAS